MSFAIVTESICTQDKHYTRDTNKLDRIESPHRGPVEQYLEL